MPAYRVYIIVFIWFATVSCGNSRNNPPQKPDSGSVAVQDSAIRQEPSSSTNQSHDTAEAKAYKNQLHSIVERMTRSQNTIRFTGNRESDFSRLMVITHFTGIELCLLHMKYTSDSSLRSIIHAKQAFLQKMEDYFHAFQMNEKTEYNPPVRKKAPTLHHLTITDNANKDVVFAKILMEYNQNTIEMAKEYLNGGSNANMKAAARNIIQTFSSETQTINAYLSGTRK